MAIPLPKAARALVALIGAGVLFSGCDKKGTASSASGSEPSGGTAGALEASASSATPAAPVKSEPVSLAEVAPQLDLTTVAMMKGVDSPEERTVTGLSYRAAGSVEAAFKFHQGQLLQKGWVEQPGSSVMPHSASATFDKYGLHVSLTVIPDKPGTAFISLRNHGNLDFSKLPLPPAAKVVYAGPLTAIYTLEQPVEAAAKSLADSLIAAGWAKYGEAGDSEWFLKNAVRLSVTTVAAPGQGGKTTMTFGSEMLPAEIPAPPDAAELQFSRSQKRLTFQTPKTQDECIAFYREKLAASGWQTKMEAPTKIDSDQVIVFRNGSNDMLNLGMRPGRSGGLGVTIDYQTTAEIAEMNRKLDAQAEAFKARKEGQAPVKQ